MSLQRKFLKALGIEDDKAEEIISAHVETVEALKAERDEYKEKAERADKLEAEKAELASAKDALQAELEEAQKNAGYAEEKQKELDTLKQEFEDYKAQVEADKVKAEKTKAFKSLLKEANVSEKRYDAIIKLSDDDIDKIAFDKDGNVEGKDDLVKSIADNWSDYIVKVKDTTPAPAKPPANTGGELVTVDSIMAIKDRAERQKMIAEHSELFGF